MNIFEGNGKAWKEVKSMAKILKMQAADIEVPAHEKASIKSWSICGGTEPSNGSKVFC